MGQDGCIGLPLLKVVVPLKVIADQLSTHLESGLYSSLPRNTIFIENSPVKSAEILYLFYILSAYETNY